MPASGREESGTAGGCKESGDVEGDGVDMLNELKWGSRWRLRLLRPGRVVAGKWEMQKGSREERYRALRGPKERGGGRILLAGDRTPRCV